MGFAKPRVIASAIVTLSPVRLRRRLSGVVPPVNHDDCSGGAMTEIKSGAPGVTTRAGCPLWPWLGTNPSATFSPFTIRT